MNNQTWLTLIMSGITDLVISAGGCLTTAMVATGTAAMPSKAVLLFATVTGLVAASRRIQALLQPTPEPR